MGAEGLPWRRELARELTRRARASVREILEAPIAFSGTARRVGITGPPGAGKSSLIAMLARHWEPMGRKLGVMAIDPTSPLSGGALLGDRIRIDEVARSSNLFIRSLSSGTAHDGLCPNIVSLLDAFERAGFEDLILETVGVGQVSYEARVLVDTLVLVLVPESGDTVQAMKAGILETADIYVVNKAEYPAAAKLAAELRSTAAWRGKSRDWTPPVILTSALEGRGASDLAAAIEAHRDAALDEERVHSLAAARRKYHIRSLILRQIGDLLASDAPESAGLSVAESLRLIIDRLHSDMAG